jgi:hypothetical protein
MVEQSTQSLNLDELTQQASAQLAQRQPAKAVVLVEKVLSVDPGQRDALKLWVEIYQQKLIQKGLHADKAYYRVLQELEKRYGGPQPKLWLGAFCAAHDQKKLALTWFEKALEIKPITPYTLTSVSAEIVTKGWYDDVINLLATRYNPQQHGVPAGVNILRAYYEFKDVEAGQALLSQLFLLQDNSQKENLLWYDNAFRQLAPPENLEPQISWSFVQIPIWCYGFVNSPTGFDMKDADRKMIIFQFTAGNGDEQEVLSRAMPLYISEQVYNRTHAAMEFLFPIEDEKKLTTLPAIPVDKEQLQAEFSGQYECVVTGEWIKDHLLMTYLDLETQQEFTQKIAVDRKNLLATLQEIEAFIFMHAKITPQKTGGEDQPDFGEITDVFIEPYLAMLDQHLQLYVALQYPSQGEPTALSKIIHHFIDLALGLPILQTQVALIGVIQKCMRFNSQIIKDSQSALLAYLDERAQVATPAQAIIKQTQGEFRAYCEN